ncbi:hypothetical protein NKG94_37955 [Micromonospora sp. M12]
MRETHIYGQSKLRIGVATNEPLMGELRNGQHVGFDVEIGRYVAASLGFQGSSRWSSCRWPPRTASRLSRAALWTWWCPALDDRGTQEAGQLRRAVLRHHPGGDGVEPAQGQDPHH